MYFVKGCRYQNNWSASLFDRSKKTILTPWNSVVVTYTPGGGEMLWAGCQDIAVGNPPVRRERSSACPSLTSTAQRSSLYTSSVYISKHLGSDFVKTISGNQMCCTLTKYWIQRWRQGLQADRIPLATLCGLVRCVALTHAPGHRPLNKRDQCCFFSMASNFFLVFLYLNATNAKCAMF